MFGTQSQLKPNMSLAYPKRQHTTYIILYAFICMHLICYHTFPPMKSIPQKGFLHSQVSYMCSPVSINPTLLSKLSRCSPVNPIQEFPQQVFLENPQQISSQTIPLPSGLKLPVENSPSEYIQSYPVIIVSPTSDW